MANDIATKTNADESASNLRAIFEILSYIHLDAQEGSFHELSDRIGFALDCAERLIKEKTAKSTSDAQPDLTASPVQSNELPTVV
ncbi:MAG: hypothetical protein NXI13_10740 [Proteobacteria bacterium]|nr:hypothetical protein [Pseudomonadota bacterium]